MRSRVLFGALAVVLLGCQATGDIGQGPAGLAAGETEPEGTSPMAIFQGAANEFGVPVALLQSIAWAETGWQMIEGESEIGLAPAYGIMALRGDALEEGAKRAGVSPDEAKTDLRANVRAAAALLAKYADELGVDKSNVADWAPAVAEYSGIEAFEGRQAYVHGEVYEALHRGIETEAMKLVPNDAIAHFPLSDAKSSPGPDYAGSVWHASPNYSSRPSGKAGTPAIVIIHDCEGAYSGCWSYLASSSSGVSAHYVVSSNGGEISQLVREKNKAWHIAATYDCGHNAKQMCDYNGQGSNNFTIGIEHAGFASQKSWDKGLLTASAKLTCDITNDWSIPRDKFHIVGHGQLQPYNRVDPGPNWPWGQYLTMVNDACGANPPQDPPQQNPPQNPPQQNPPQNPPNAPLVIVVDSNQSANGADAQCVVSGSWTSSNNVAGYYNTGYWWRSVGATNDAAEFRAKLPKAMKVKVQAWWPAAGDRSTKAPFSIYDASNVQLDTVYVNQQANGGTWVDLGTYPLTAGWNTVALSRWTSGSGVVVADAVRFVEMQ